MSSSQSERSEGEPNLRPSMSVSPFRAAIDDTMSMPPVAGEHQQDRHVIEIGPHQTDPLHLLVTDNRNNDEAVIVFGRYPNLLGTRNMMSETPLHIAAKVGNYDFIYRIINNYLPTVKMVLRERNKEGDTAMHVAVKYGHADVGLSLMGCSPEVAYEVNEKMLSPLNIAITKGNLNMVRRMLGVDRALASTPFSDGMFPVHVAARMGQTKMVMHFIVRYRDAAKLLDPRGRNLLHIATEEGQNLAAELDRAAEEDWKLAAEEDQNLAAELDRTTEGRNFLNEMLKETDYEGNSLLHVAAMKGHLPLMKDIWEKYHREGDKINNQGLTPIDLFVGQLRATTKVDDSFARTTDQKNLSAEWFKDAMPLPIENKWIGTDDVIGLGSVLITSVTFAAAFTFPGGYNQNDGTPLLGRSYMFRAFIISNTIAFIYGFLCLWILLMAHHQARRFAVDVFMLAMCSMLAAFGLGLYVTLASVGWPLAIIVLLCTFIISIVNNFTARAGNRRNGLLLLYAGTFLLIFGLAKV